MSTLLTQPRGPVPPIATGGQEIAVAAQHVAFGSGPIAVDVERASGFRYNERAFVLQLKRQGTGIILFDVESDPAAITKHLGPVLNHNSWIIHSAINDLPCLADLGLFPHHIFDTELAGRLLGIHRVNLSAMTEHYLGITLRKQHSAQDWSRRPLPTSWLNYAALDVELLIELAQSQQQDLKAADKLHWLQQECDYLIDTYRSFHPQPKTWLDLKGVSKLESPAQLAVAKNLWLTRDRIGQATDTACSAVLPDKALIALAENLPKRRKQLVSLSVYPARLYKDATQWLEVIRSTLAQSPDSWPSLAQVRDHHHHRAAVKGRCFHYDPAARSVLELTKSALAEVAAAHNVLLENLIQPSVVRSIVWESVHHHSINNSSVLLDRLASLGVRPWQQELTFDILETLLLDLA